MTKGKKGAVEIELRNGRWRSHGRVHVRGCSVPDAQRAERLIEAVASRRHDEVSLWLHYGGAGYWITLRVGDLDTVSVWGDQQSAAFDDMEKLLGL